MSGPPSESNPFASPQAATEPEPHLAIGRGWLTLWQTTSSTSIWMYLSASLLVLLGIMALVQLALLYQWLGAEDGFMTLLAFIAQAVGYLASGASLFLWARGVGRFRATPSSHSFERMIAGQALFWKVSAIAIIPVIAFEIFGNLLIASSY